VKEKLELPEENPLQKEKSQPQRKSRAKPTMRQVTRTRKPSSQRRSTNGLMLSRKSSEQSAPM